MDSTTDTGCSDSYNSYGKSHSSGTSLSCSSDINAISVDLGDGDNISCNGLKYLPTWPAINLEFRDLTYEVYDVHTKGKFSKYLVIVIIDTKLRMNRENR